MRKYSFTLVDVCTDCLFAAAYGPGAVENPADSWRALWDSAVIRESGARLVASCPDPRHVDPVTGESCRAVSFSWHECDWCRSTLGGDRHHAAYEVQETVGA